MGIFGISIISHIVDRMQYRKTKVERCSEEMQFLFEKKIKKIFVF